MSKYDTLNAYMIGPKVGRSYDTHGVMRPYDLRESMKNVLSEIAINKAYREDLTKRLSTLEHNTAALTRSNFELQKRVEELEQQSQRAKHSINDLKLDVDDLKRDMGEMMKIRAMADQLKPHNT